jgi:hypothetical protein
MQGGEVPGRLGGAVRFASEGEARQRGLNEQGDAARRACQDHTGGPVNCPLYKGEKDVCSPGLAVKCPPRTPVGSKAISCEHTSLHESQTDLHYMRHVKSVLFTTLPTSPPCNVAAPSSETSRTPKEHTHTSNHAKSGIRLSHVLEYQ